MAVVTQQQVNNTLINTSRRRTLVGEDFIYDSLFFVMLSVFRWQTFRGKCRN